MQSETPQAASKRSLLKPGLIMVGLVVLLLLTFSWIFDSIGATALNKAVLQARSLGGPVSLEELQEAQRSWPDDQNGALLILSIKPTLDAVANGLSDDQRKFLPVFGVTRRDSDLGRQWSPQTAEAVATLLEGHRDDLAVIDKLRSYAGGRFPIQYAANPLDTLLPHLQPLRTAARLKHLQTLDRARRGDTASMVEDIETLYRHASLLEGDITLISSLVSIAIQSLTVSTIEEVCSVAALTPDQLERMQRLVPADHMYQRLCDAVRWERGFFIAAADHFRRTGDLANIGATGSAAVVRLPGAKGWLMQDEAAGIESFNRLLAQSTGPAMRKQARDNEMQQASAGRLNVFSGTILPSLTRAITLHLRAAAEQRAARVGIAAERFRLATGQWPATLDDLVPTYIDAIPEDPFAPGNPLRMALRDQQLVVYSIGENEMDDRGDVIRGKDRGTERDHGFILLAPAARNQPPLPDESPAEDPAVE